MRWRAGVKAHRKPRWIPRAPSKTFVLPGKDHTPEAELEQIMKLKFEHRNHVAALTQYLWEDYLKSSSAGKEAQMQQEREEEEHANLLIKNEHINARVVIRRQERLEREAQEEEQRIRMELEDAKKREKEQAERIDDVIKYEKKQIENRITVDELERAILQAIDNPVDDEFAIDTEGHIYRGRYTKSIAVPSEQREKIPAPLTEADSILGIDKMKQEL